MRGLPRMLIMFAPMIFRAVSKFIKKRNAAKQRDDMAQKSYNQSEDKANKEEGSYKNKDLV